MDIFVYYSLQYFNLLSTMWPTTRKVIGYLYEKHCPKTGKAEKEWGKAIDKNPR